RKGHGALSPEPHARRAPLPERFPAETRWQSGAARWRVLAPVAIVLPPERRRRGRRKESTSDAYYRSSARVRPRSKANLTPPPGYLHAKRSAGRSSQALLPVSYDFEGA